MLYREPDTRAAFSVLSRTYQSSTAVISAVVRRMQQNELVQIMPGWELALPVLLLT